MGTETIGFMDTLYAYDISVIQWLQTRFSHQGELFSIISTVFAPRYAFFLFIPLIYAFNRTAGNKILFVAIISGWTNMVMKWILQGERPYWWIHETTLYDRKVNFQQYSATCETEPGNPSAHALCTTSVWYMITSSLLQKLEPSTSNRHLCYIICWSTYTLIIGAVSLSRVFLAAHFPHQCLLGISVGCTIIVAVRILPVDKMKFKHYAMMSFVLLSSSIIIYVVLKTMGKDPMWSEYKAKKWCSNQDHIRIHTTPLYYIIRYSGLALGMGLGLNSFLIEHLSADKFTVFMKLTCAAISIFITNFVYQINILLKFNLFHFHIMTLCFYVLLPYTFIAAVPFAVNKLWPLVNGKSKIG